VIATAPTSGSLPATLALVLGAECTFATLVRLVTGAPPAFLTTVAFGLVLAVLLAVQTARTDRPTQRT